MKKTLLILLAAASANVAFAQNPPLTANQLAALSNSEHLTLEAIMMMVNMDRQKALDKQVQDMAAQIRAHSDARTQGNINVTNLTGQDMLKHIKLQMEKLTSVTNKPNYNNEDIKHGFTDDVMLNFDGKHHEQLQLELAMNPHNGQYMIRSINDVTP